MASRPGSFSFLRKDIEHQLFVMNHLRTLSARKTGQTVRFCDFVLEDQLLPNELSLSFQVWYLLRGQGRSAPPSSVLGSDRSAKGIWTCERTAILLDFITGKRGDEMLASDEASTCVTTCL